MVHCRSALTTLILLIALCGTAIRASDVETVIGGLTESEGGDFSPNDGQLKNPFGVDFDSVDNLYVVELAGGRVFRFDTNGQLSRIAGDGSKSYSGDGSDADAATFNGMHTCVVTPDDQLLIADSWNHCVRRIDLDDRTIDTVAGAGEAGFGGDGGPATTATFNFVMCIALNADGDVVHVTDLKNRRIRNVDLDSGIVATVAGNGNRGVPTEGSKAVDNPLLDPRAAASDHLGNLYVLERGGNALRVVRPDGTIHTVAGTGKRGYRDGAALTAQFGEPKHLCTDPNGNVYIADDKNGAIRKYDPTDSQVSTVLGRGIGDERIRLSHPHGVRWHDGWLYVVDSGNNRVLRVRVE